MNVKTKINVRLYKESDGEIVALFIGEEHSHNGYPTPYTCYSHVGQHSTGIISYFKDDCEEVTEEEGKDLLHELRELIGYDVTVLPHDPVLSNKVCRVIYRLGDKEVSGRDLKDLNNEPAFYTTNKRGLKKAWEALEKAWTDKTTMNEAMRILGANGIRAHYWCMMD